MDFLVSAAIGLLFVSGAVLLVLGSMLAARRLLHPGAESDRTNEVLAAVGMRIAALHGLILALVYAQELDNYKGIRSALNDEAIAVSDLFNDIRRYGGPAVAPVQTRLAQYLSTVVNDEWDSLGQRQELSSKAWTEWEDVYDRLLDLTPATGRETFLAGRLRSRATDIARLRQMREAAAADHFSALFWAPALIGLVFLAVPFFLFRPTWTHLTLIGFFGAYSGVILFFIYSFGNPFTKPGMLEPVAFERLLAGEIGRSLPQGGP